MCSNSGRRARCLFVGWLWVLVDGGMRGVGCVLTFYRCEFACCLSVDGLRYICGYGSFFDDPVPETGPEVVTVIVCG